MSETGRLPPPFDTSDTDQDEAKPHPQRTIAVALENDRETAAPPRITASGYGKVAEQILEIAFANGVKVREDAPLAEILSHLEVESEVPLEALAAVAEILRYVYMANSAMAQDSTTGPGAKS